jgi:ferrochelatase
MKKTAVVLFNLGGPDSLESVEPFLFNLFCDPDIFNIPFGQRLLARFISRRRAPKVQERYRLIGGSSPINDWTEKQRCMLEAALAQEGRDVVVYTAMRYWHPLIQKVADELSGSDYERIVLLPLFPQFSKTTTGSAFNEWERTFHGSAAMLSRVSSYHDHPAYIAAVNGRIDEAMKQFPANARADVRILFSAHGIPESLVKKGDPYSRQIGETVQAVMKARHFSHTHHLCFQSRVGPVKWLSPATEETIRRLGAEGRKHLLVVPISFVSDHIETLHELDVEYREVAVAAGVENFIVMEGLNDSETFIGALKDIVKNNLKNNGLTQSRG